MTNITERYINKQLNNAQVFFLPLETRPSYLPPLIDSHIKKYWHTGIVYKDKVYETLNKARYRISDKKDRYPELVDQKAEFFDVNIDTNKLKSEVTSGTSCEQLVLRVLGLSNLKGEDKGELYPDDVYIMVYNKYDPPYDIKHLEAKKSPLLNDPPHRWRAETGIELIHKEPDIFELKRIWKNWNLMPEKMKKISDKKSIEFFGVTNEENYKKLIILYDKDTGKILNQKLYRYEDQDGLGIMSNKYYKEKIVPDKVWEKIKWLPKPEIYATCKSCKSYFTEEGNDRFRRENLSLFKKYIPKINLIIKNKNDLEEVVYKDTYQIIEKTS